MDCLRCGRTIPETFFIQRSRSPEFKGGRFACPHCGAEHVRRTVGALPSGEPLYTYRLWGHLKSVQRHRPAEPKAGADRRKSARARRWR